MPHIQTSWQISMCGIPIEHDEQGGSYSMRVKQASNMETLSMMSHRVIVHASVTMPIASSSAMWYGCIKKVLDGTGRARGTHTSMSTTTWTCSSANHLANLCPVWFLCLMFHHSLLPTSVLFTLHQLPSSLSSPPASAPADFHIH